jgi:hypothetical protein
MCYINFIHKNIYVLYIKFIFNLYILYIFILIYLCFFIKYYLLKYHLVFDMFIVHL